MSISFSGDPGEQVVTSTSILPEDTGEVSLRPRSLSDYIGQEKVKENLSVFIKAAKMRGEPGLTTCCSTALRASAKRHWRRSLQTRWESTCA